MAYFDNPEKAARWERELSALRAEKERRQALPRVFDRNAGMSLSPAAVETRAKFGMARVAEPKVWSPPVRLHAALQKTDNKKPVTLIRGEPITFAQLMAELEDSAPEPAFTPEPEPVTERKPQAFAAAPPRQKAEPISFEKLLAESGMKKAAAKPASSTGMSLCPAPEPITFGQLKAEAAQKRAM